MPAKPCSVSPFYKEKSRPYWNLHSRQNSETYCMPAPWKPLQTLRKLKLKISRTLWTCACAFSPGLLALMLDYTPSVPPLPPLKYGSDGRKGQQPVWGQQLRGRWMGGESGGFVCHSEPSLTFTGPKTEQREGEREDGGGGLRAVNSERFSKLCSSIRAWISSRSCMPWFVSFGLSRGLDSLRFMYRDSLDLIVNLRLLCRLCQKSFRVVYEAAVLGSHILMVLIVSVVLSGHGLFIKCLLTLTWSSTAEVCRIGSGWDRLVCKGETNLWPCIEYLLSVI